MPFEKGKSGNPETQWKKGQSGNPNGRRNAAKDILNKLLDVEVDDRSQREQLMLKLIQMGMRGDLGAIKEVLDRTEGKSKEHIITEEFKPLRVLEFGDDVIDDTQASGKVQSNYGRAKIRKVSSGVGIPFKRANVAGRKSMVHIPNLQAGEDNSLANIESNNEGQGLENQRDGAQLYSVRCYDCD